MRCRVAEASWAKPLFFVVVADENICHLKSTVSRGEDKHLLATPLGANKYVIFCICV